MKIAEAILAVHAYVANARAPLDPMTSSDEDSSEELIASANR